MNKRRMLSWAGVASGIMHGSRAFTGPFQASIELTNRCNIRCIHCHFYSPYIERPNFFALRRARQLSGELPDVNDLRKLQTLDADSGMTKNIIDTLVKMGTRKFFFSGSGEPRAFRYESLRINRGGEKVDGCECNSCPHFTANLLVFNSLHPIKSRSLTLKKLSYAGAV